MNLKSWHIMIKKAFFFCILIVVSCKHRQKSDDVKHAALMNQLDSIENVLDSMIELRKRQLRDTITINLDSSRLRVIINNYSKK